LEAWLTATEHIMQVGPCLNLILSIKSPGSDGAYQGDARKLIDDYYDSIGEYPIHTVAETIFPGWEYRKRGIKGVFETYANTEYDLIRKNWGTYAYRLVRRTTSTGEVINPLEKLIEKMKSESQLPGPKKACYELGVAEGEYDLPLYNVVEDQNPRMGLPCLSHLSFKYHEGKVHLSATYRSHDYQLKVLGNMLGLARLQACIAREIGSEIGTMLVHSTYANFQGGGKRKFNDLVSRLRKSTTERRQIGLVS
jgi:hypothetical protein